MKKFAVILLVIVVAFFVLASGKNLVAKASVEGAVKSMTGLTLKMQKLDVGILKTYVTIANLTLFNPGTFEDKVMLDLPEVHIDYNLRSILGKKIHLEEVRLNLREFIVVKNSKGELNLNYLKPKGEKDAQEKEVSPSKAEPQTQAKPESKQPFDIQIDRLHLKIGKVVYKDYSVKGETSVQEFEINLNETHENITNPNVLVALLVGKALMNTTIASIANVDIEGFASKYGLDSSSLDGLGLDKFKDMAANIDTEKLQAEAAKYQEKAKKALEDERVQEALRQAQEKAKELLSQTGEASGEAGAGVAEKADEVVESLKSLFGQFSE